jgi:hypothetical protein
LPGVLPAAGIAHAIATQRQVFDGEGTRFREFATSAAGDRRDARAGLLDAAALQGSLRERPPQILVSNAPAGLIGCLHSLHHEKAPMKKSLIAVA